MLVTYDSIPEFVAIARQYSHFNPWSGPSWYNHTSFSDAAQWALDGDEKLVPQAEELLSRIDDAVTVRQPSWEPDYVGAWVCVPEALMGIPDCMRRREETACDSAPINIYVSTTCSAGIDAETMLKRGVAILALLMKLQTFRPVQLYLLAETHGRTDGEYIQVIRVDSQPVNLSVACHVLANVGFARHLTYNVARGKDGFTGAWPRNYSSGGSLWESHIRELLGLTENDLYIGAACVWDEMITRPIDWVNAHVKRFAGDGE